MGTDNSRYGVTKEDIMRAAMADFDDFDDPSTKVSSQPQTPPQVDIYSNSNGAAPVDYSNNIGVQPDYGNGYVAQDSYATPSVMYCTACGNAVAPDSRFCTACGNDLSALQADVPQQDYNGYGQYDDITVIADSGMYGQDPAYADPYAPNPYAQDAGYQADPYAQQDAYVQDPYAANPYDQGAAYGGDSVIFCTGCGSQMPADMRFCTVCGTPLANQDDSAPFMQGYDDPFQQNPNAGFGVQAPPMQEKKKGGFFSKKNK